MKFIITGTLVVCSVIGYAIYFLHKSEQTPQYLTPKYWKTVTPKQLKVKLKIIKNVNKIRLDNKQTMLHLLALYGQHPEMIGLLINAGADYRIKDDDNDGDEVTAIYYTITRKEKAFEFTKEMLKYIENVDEPFILDQGLVSLLAIAAYNNPTSMKILRLLLKKGANPNFIIEKGYTPFMFVAGAAKTGQEFYINPQVIQLFLDYGADITLMNQERKSAFDYMSNNPVFTKTKVFKKISSQLYKK